MSEQELLEQLTAAGFEGQTPGRHQTSMHRTNEEDVDYLVQRPGHARASRVRKFISTHTPPADEDDLLTAEGEPLAVYREVLTWARDSSK